MRNYRDANYRAPLKLIRKLDAKQEIAMIDYLAFSQTRLQSRYIMLLNILLESGAEWCALGLDYLNSVSFLAKSVSVHFAMSALVNYLIGDPNRPAKKEKNRFKRHYQRRCSKWMS